MTVLSARAATDSTACAKCHTAQAETQPETSMARALQMGTADPLFETHPKLTFQKGDYAYTVEQRDGTPMYTVTDGAHTLSLPIHYAFGAGSQTFVLEHDGRLYESFVSYYPKIDGLDVTMGDQQLQPKTLVEAMGRELSDAEASACFGCHSSGAVVKKNLQLESMVPGVSCEHCHVGASEHLEAITHGKLTSIPPKLKRLPAEEISSFCGRCHRTWETVMRNNWHGVINVRFQPYRLANSKCFDGVDQRISCIGCHNPHREIVRDDRAYDAKCLACHSANAKPSAGTLAENAGAAGGTVVMKTCPVTKSDCVSCHMPKVELPGGHMVFADHDIRVVRTGEAYPN